MPPVDFLQPYQDKDYGHETFGFCCYPSFISFIFIYLGTVPPSVHENCFSGGRGIPVLQLFINCHQDVLANEEEGDNRPYSCSAKEPGSSVIFMHFYTRDLVEWR